MTDLTGQKNRDPYPWSTWQVYEDYSDQDHGAWQSLFEKRLPQLTGLACDAFLQGVNTFRLNALRLPHLAQLSARMRAFAGWSIWPVRTSPPAAVFFDLLSKKTFPSTIALPKSGNATHIPEPDIFRDTFGHVPMFCNRHFRNFLQQLGKFASSTKKESEIALLSKVYWFTAKFGLLRSFAGTQIYGGSLLSSHAACHRAMSPDCEVRPFHLDDIETQHFDPDCPPRVLFEIDSLEQLTGIAADLYARLS